MSNPKFFSLRSRIKSFGFAIEGIVVFFKTQFNAWIHLLLACLACILGYLFEIDKAEWCWIALAIALVLITEMLNTALEFLTDLVSPSVHPLAKKVKDVAAGAVLLAAIAALAIAAIIFIPKL
jgi:diacylglycerol kinase